MDVGRWIGIAVSAVVHLGAAAVLLIEDPDGGGTPSEARALTISLQMREPPAAAEALVASETPPEPPPEPEPQPDPEPEPVPEVSRRIEEPPPSPPVSVIEKPSPTPVAQTRPLRKPAPKRPVSAVLHPAPAAASVPVSAKEDAMPPTLPVDVDLDAVRQSYLAALAGALHRHKHYPRRARRRKEQGTVMLSFVIEKDGKLVDMRISDSSGFERLDKAALDTLHRLERFRPIPDVLGRDRWPISVPVEYRLM